MARALGHDRFAGSVARPLKCSIAEQANNRAVFQHAINAVIGVASCECHDYACSNGGRQLAQRRRLCDFGAGHTAHYTVRAA